jgi:hypothetical protein
MSALSPKADIMFAYIATYLLNHGLGVVSLALAESGLRLEMAFWRTR